MSSIGRYAIGFSLLLGACATPSPSSGFAGVVTSASPEATAAGVRILEAGGNAIDAAVAVSLTLGVSEPAGSGIGGQVYILLWHPEHGGKVIQGSTRSPKVLPKGLTRADLRGHKATTIPSALRVLDVAHRRFGSGRISWAQACAPAIECARDGYRRGFFRQQSLNRYGAAIADRLSASPDGLVRRPELARTLQRIATHGAADFYTGETAAAIAADMKQHGGFLTAEDLRSFPEPTVGDPLVGTYRNDTILTLPPPTGGWVVLRALNVLSHAKRSQLQANQRSRALWMAQALRLAHGDRYDAPIRDDADLNKKLDKQDVRRELRERGVLDWSRKGGSGETTHFCAVDGDGMVVAVSQSLNAYYGAKAFAGDMGFFYNDYMREFVVGRGDHPFELGGDKEPYSSMSATIVLRDGKPILTAGSPGSRRIISAVVQVLSNVLDAGLSIGAAVAHPRMHVVPEEDQLMLEQRPREPAVIGQFEAWDFDVAIPLSGLGRQRRSPYFGGVHAMAFDPVTGWTGAADPRRDGVATAARANQ